MAKKGQKQKKYSAEFKIGVILDMREHHLSYYETVRKYWDVSNGQEQNYSRQVTLPPFMMILFVPLPKYPLNEIQLIAVALTFFGLAGGEDCTCYICYGFGDFFFKFVHNISLSKQYKRQNGVTIIGNSVDFILVQ